MDWTGGGRAAESAEIDSLFLDFLVSLVNEGLFFGILEDSIVEIYKVAFEENEKRSRRRRTRE